jgi:hypothetical protein
MPSLKLPRKDRLLPPEINIATSRKKGAASSPGLDTGAWLHALMLGPTQSSVTLLRYTNGAFLISSCTHIATERKKEVKHIRLQERGDR